MRDLVPRLAWPFLGRLADSQGASPGPNQVHHFVPRFFVPRTRRRHTQIRWHTLPHRVHQRGHEKLLRGCGFVRCLTSDSSEYNDRWIIANFYFMPPKSSPETEQGVNVVLGMGVISMALGLTITNVHEALEKVIPLEPFAGQQIVGV